MHSFISLLGFVILKNAAAMNVTYVVTLMKNKRK